MTVKHLYQLVFLVCLYGCSAISADDQAHITGQSITDFSTNDQVSKTDQSKIGLYIENGQRQGFQYLDSSKTEYNYRYYTITITNDTIIPIQLEIGFSKTEMSLSNSSNSKVFLLPRHLTPNEQHFDHSISMELKRFLDFEIGKLEHLNKTLSPNEKCVLTFGVLTDTKYPDPTTPFETKLLTSNENSSVISFKLKINDTSIIPCGQFSYLEK